LISESAIIGVHLRLDFALMKDQRRINAGLREASV